MWLKWFEVLIFLEVILFGNINEIYCMIMEGFKIIFFILGVVDLKFWKNLWKMD